MLMIQPYLALRYYHLLKDSIQTLFDHIDPLMEFNPPFVDVTYHREEFV